MQYSLSWKVNTIIILVTSLVLLSSGGYEVSQTWRRLNDELNGMSANIADRLALTLTGPMWSFDDETIWTFMRGEMGNPNVLAIVVERPVGLMTTFTVRHDKAGRIIQLTEPQTITDGYIEQKRHVIKDKYELGEVRVYMADTVINQTYWSDLTRLLTRTGGLLGVLVLTLFISLSRFVINPVKELTENSTIIAQGDLDEKIGINRSDEIGVLAHSFELMRNAVKEKITALNEEITERRRVEAEVRSLNEALEQRVAMRTQELQSALNETHELFKAAQGILGANELEVIGHYLITHFNNLVQADLMLLFLVDHEQRKIILRMAQERGQVREADLTYEDLENGISGLVFNQKCPILSLHADDGIEPEATRESRRRSAPGPLVVVPLMTKGQVVGTITAINQPHQRSFAEHDVELLMALATQAATAIENVRLYQLAQIANRELLKLNADKDKFFSIMAHDLKGPFMPLLGNAELLTEMGDILPPAEVKQLGASIQRTARNVFSLLENLLQWARLQMGRMEYNPQRLDVYEIAAKSVELLSGNASVKQIELRNQVAPDTWVYADENMLDTVIRNLVNNALKFTPQGGQVTISSELGVMSDELKNTPHATLNTHHYVEISIADTGVGMSSEVKQKLFKIDQQVTTVGTGKETGTGLGLIICQEMVVKSGGHIWVESEIGKGTTVRFTVKLDSEQV